VTVTELLVEMFAEIVEFQGSMHQDRAEALGVGPPSARGSRGRLLHRTHENVHRREVILGHGLRDMKSRQENTRRNQKMSSTITEPVTARMRGNAIAAVEAWAAQDGTTRSKFIAQAVYRELERRDEGVSAGVSGGQDV
jgi:hypothetical protein